MAVVSAWSKPGSWALDSESVEPTETAAAAPASDFPSLSAAVATKVPKKKKAQAISLAEFTNGPANPSPAATRLTIDEKLALPTGPRERTAEELERPRGGFGFSSYNPGDRSGRNRAGGDEPRRDRSGPVDNGPSRADEVDDWGKMKKSPAPESRRGGFYESNANPSRADDSDRWTSNKRDLPPPVTDSRRSGSNNWGFSKERDLSSDTWGKKREEIGNGGTSTGTGSRPRLVLQPRTLPVVIESNADLTPQSDQLSESGSSGRNKGANPFGAARPREEVLAEKGQDWRKIDEKLESVKLEEKPSFGSKKVSEGNGNGNGNASESRTESAWRKPINLAEPEPAQPASLENGDEEKEEGTVEN
ncbi:hypothetical protein LUZ60_016155 [Juncus effusus]|nr:hypothetical protein LUZ60_016155 [Juncus effusus]